MHIAVYATMAYAIKTEAQRHKTMHGHRDKTKMVPQVDSDENNYSLPAVRGV